MVMMTMVMVLATVMAATQLSKPRRNAPASSFAKLRNSSTMYLIRDPHTSLQICCSAAVLSGSSTNR